MEYCCSIYLGLHKDLLHNKLYFKFYQYFVKYISFLLYYTFLTTLMVQIYIFIKNYAIISCDNHCTNDQSLIFNFILQGHNRLLHIWLMIYHNGICYTLEVFLLWFNNKTIIFLISRQGYHYICKKLGKEPKSSLYTCKKSANKYFYRINLKVNCSFFFSSISINKFYN